MIYTTGTIAVSGNTLTGTGTNFTAAGSLIRVGCTVLTMTSPPQVFQITGITSGTVMTVSPAASPALAAGTKYSILLSDSLSVDGLAQDIAETFGMYQRNISGFADVMNGTGDVTVTIDSKAVTVPGQKSLAKKGANADITSLTGLTTALSIAQGGTGSKTADTARIALSAAKSGVNNDITSITGLTTALPITQGGTGATTAAGIRQNAGLKSAAERDVGTAASNVMEVGAFGLGGYGPSMRSTEYLNSKSGIPCGFFRQGGGVSDNDFSGFGAGLSIPYGSVGSRIATAHLYVVGSGEFKVQWRLVDTSTGEATGRVSTVYTNTNTTKASDGTLKAASPVARIASPDASTRPDIDEDSFEWCGYGVANDEAHGIEIIRDDIGVYRVTGAKSLASSGWRLLPPRDPDGSGDLGVVTTEQLDDEIVISLFRRKMVLVDGEIAIQPGEPIDVPTNSWIDIRMDMPEPVIPPEPPVQEPLIQPE